MTKSGRLSFVSVILSLYLIVGLWSFFSNAVPLLFPLDSLFSASHTPEEWFAHSFGPEYEVLLVVTKKTPDGSIICFPDDFYQTVFDKGDPFYRYFFLERKAVRGNSSTCEYVASIKNEAGNSNMVVEVHKK
jgi:hypothetical protein